MRRGVLAAACLGVLLLATAAGALTAEEVIRLKKAGVSEATIQKMLEAEAAGVSTNGPITVTKDEVIYKSGENVRSDIQRNKEHERWKEEKSLDALKGVIIDQRSGDTTAPGTLKSRKK
ncbi:MAG: hypothetical protein PVG60_01895 [Desulfarculaceae bacterium]|jgi:hypothetical protein